MMVLAEIAVVFLPLLAAMVVGLGGKKLGDRIAQLLTCGAIGLAAFFSVVVFDDVALNGHSVNFTLFEWIRSGTFSASWGIKIDALTAVMLAVVMIVSAMVHVYSIGYMKGDKSKPRFMAYLSLFTFFMAALVTAPNLVQMFFGWEGVGLMSYLLINFWFERPSANAASMKAFLVNRVGDFGFLLGIFACYRIFGSTDFEAMFAAMPQAVMVEWTLFGQPFHVVTLIAFLLFMGAMGKSAQLGLHTWLPDAMEGPTPVSALIHAATMVTAGVFMVARMSPLFEHAPCALTFITVIGALTCVLAAAVSLTQFDIKRVIAYSTMSQLGYMFFAAGVSAYSASMYHLMTHAFFKALLFLCAGSVIHALSGEQDMRKMGGLWRSIPITYALMAVGFLALAGIGIDGVFGFAGFYSKDLILEAAYNRGTGIGTLAYVLGLLAAFMTAFYSGRLMLMTFHGEPREEEPVLHHVHESSWTMLAPLIPLALGAIFAGWFAYDWFGGEEREAFWNGAIFVLPEHDSIAAAEQSHGIHKGLPVLVAALGLLCSYVFYVPLPEMPAIVSTAFGSLYRLVYHKFYIDELYDFLFVSSSRRVGYVLWKKGDEEVIDGCGPDGVASLAVQIAKRIGRLESGYLYHYAFAMIVGVAVFISWFWLKG